MTVTSITFEIPLTPIPKPRPRVTRWGTYTPKRAKDYEDDIKKIAKPYFDKPITEPCEITLQFTMPIPKSTSKKLRGELMYAPHTKKTGDVDNLVKAVTDALNGIAYEDDSLIWKLEAQKMYGEVGQTVVTIETDQ